jgi:tetratricopeptide (TPR) repeat protein
LGDALIKAGHFDEAAVHLRQAIEINDYYTAHQNLGYALASKGEWADAIPSFRAAIRLRPNYPQAYTNLGVSLSKLGRTDEALAEFQEAVRFDPDYRDAHFDLAILLLQLGRREEAILHFREALRLRPDDATVKEQLRQLETEN